VSNDEQISFDLNHFQKTLVNHWDNGDDTKEEEIVSLVFYLYSNIKKVFVVNFDGTYYIKVITNDGSKYEINMR
jgi:predicted enzyme involved in methoxymalonyl-ACP biosynthesis